MGTSSDNQKKRENAIHVTACGETHLIFTDTNGCRSAKREVAGSSLATLVIILALAESLSIRQTPVRTRVLVISDMQSGG